MAYAGALVPAEVRATGMATVQTGQALARMVSSVVFGVMLASLTMTVAVGVLAAVMVSALLVVGFMVRRRSA
jgi:hypothetical protein